MFSSIDVRYWGELLYALVGALHDRLKRTDPGLHRFYEHVRLVRGFEVFFAIVSSYSRSSAIRASSPHSSGRAFDARIDHVYFEILSTSVSIF